MNVSIVINCPSKDVYQVFLTEMLTNTTIVEITNEIKGAPDSEETGPLTDENRDYTRRLIIEDVRVSLVRPSYEYEEPLYRDSLFVIYLN